MWRIDAWRVMCVAQFVGMCCKVRVPYFIRNRIIPMLIPRLVCGISPVVSAIFASTRSCTSDVYVLCMAVYLLSMLYCQLHLYVIEHIGTPYYTVL